MAIAFARVSIHTRSKGHSAIAASAYRSGKKLLDARTVLNHDFSKRQEVVHSEVILPSGTNEIFLKREDLWNAAEAAEKRRDAQICKDFVLALPKELDLSDQIELAKRFISTFFINNGLPCDISIHDDGKGNPHAHMLVPTRRLEKNGFSKYKARDLNPGFAKGFVVENDYWGEKWRDIQSEYFLEKGMDFRVDLNHILSGRHEGKIENGSHYVAEENKLIAQARVEVALNSINKIIEHLYAKYSVFTRRDVEKLLFKTLKQGNSSYDYLAKVEEVLGNKNVIEIGTDSQGKAVFTTRQQFVEEQLLQRNIHQLMNSSNHKLNWNVEVNQSVSLSEEQKAAYNFIIQGPDISAVVGRAGTGKSYLLKPLKEAYEIKQFKIIGAALSGKVAKSLQAETGIESSTIASLLYRLENKQIQLTNRHVLVVDEAGMVDCKSMSKLIKSVKNAGSKVVLVGDPDQLRPINKGEIFRGIAAKTGYIELENIRRQSNPDDRKASLDLARGHVQEALNHYDSKGAIKFSESLEDATIALIKDWKKQLLKENLKTSTIISFTKKSVSELNSQARQAFKELNLLKKKEIKHQVEGKDLYISIGERLLFKKNNKMLGIRNGDIGTVQSLNEQGINIELDNGEPKQIPYDYKAVDYGYALTVHKAQGMTTEKCFVLIDNAYWDRNLSYVALTRHKKDVNIYVDKLQHPILDDLKKTMSTEVRRKNVMDWVPQGVGIYHHLNTVSGRELKIKNKENLNLENQLIRKYSVLQEQLKTQAGYFAEKTQKEMDTLVKNFLSDKGLQKEIREKNPSFLNEINKNSQQKRERNYALNIKTH
jgi:Ti-type conjugative transfer relaxase TraA